MRSIRFRIITYFGKIIYFVSVKVLRGSGSALPGRVVEVIYPKFIKDLFYYQDFQHRIIITGTNGKTTTTKLIVHGLNKVSKKPIFTNRTGSNLPRGIISQYLADVSWGLKLGSQVAVLEVDEGMIESLIGAINPDNIIILNIFRDQLDRFGESNNVFIRIKQKITEYLNCNPSQKVKIYLNADDPIVSRINDNALFFGVDTTIKTQHITTEPSSLDYDYDLISREPLLYNSYTIAHLGDYYLSSGSWKRPKRDFVLVHLEKNKPIFNTKEESIKIDSKLQGNYNLYNQVAALSLLSDFLKPSQLSTVFEDFQSAFGRQEKIEIGDNTINLNLVKNPVGMVECLNLLQFQNPDFIIFILNNRYADSEDVSWIWDVDLSSLINYCQKKNFNNSKNLKNNVYVFGDRKYDMGLRLYYSGIQYSVITNSVLSTINNFQNANISIFATYTAMLDFREELVNNKIVQKKLV